jgi:hypothetical protein
MIESIRMNHALHDRLGGTLVGLVVCDAVVTTVEFMAPGTYT